jgi:hypothetical protein
MFCCESLPGRQRQTVWVRIPQTRRSSFLDLVPWSPPPSIYLIEDCNPILPSLALLRNCRLWANSTVFMDEDIRREAECSSRGMPLDQQL